MTIHSYGERERFVRSLVQGGEFASEAEVKGEALRRLQEFDRQAKLAELRREMGCIRLEAAPNFRSTLVHPYVIESSQFDPIFIRRGAARVAWDQ